VISTSTASEDGLDAAARTEYGILGPLAVWIGGTELRIDGRRQKRALAALLLNANRVVSAEHLIEILWGDDPPPTAAVQIRNTIAALRRQLDIHRPGRVGPIRRAGTGFIIRLDADRLDAHVFADTAAVARELAAGGQLVGAAGALRDALALWRGPALDGLGGSVLDAAARRLEEQRLACLEQRLELDLALGRHHDIVGELAALVAHYPLWERLVELLMLALHRSGRRQDALEAFAAARSRLAEQTGLDPRPELIRLQQAILNGDRRLDPKPAAGENSPGPHELPAPAAASPLSVVPCQLPANLVDFVGRSDELRTLNILAGSGRGDRAPVTVIHGGAGVGKSALAVQWGHQARDRFSDGQLYVDLRGTAPDPIPAIDALAVLLHALGVPVGQMPAELDQAVLLYRNVVAGRRLLLLFDNARDPDQVRPLLPAGTGSYVLVTSRDRMAGLVALDGVRRLNLDVLTPDDAQTLLARILGPDRIKAESGPAAQLARLCGWLPLALRIAAANLVEQKELSIAEYTARMWAGNRLAGPAVDEPEPGAALTALDRRHMLRRSEDAAAAASRFILAIRHTRAAREAGNAAC
jgi:DNA-binding SARP family transcriptional activator